MSNETYLILLIATGLPCILAVVILSIWQQRSEKKLEEELKRLEERRKVLFKHLDSEA